MLICDAVVAFIVSQGYAELDDVCAALGIDAEEAVVQAGFGESSTVGGLLCALAGRIPRAGDQIPFSGYLFTVREVEDGRLILNVGAKRMVPVLPAEASLQQNLGAVGAGQRLRQWSTQLGESETGHDSDGQVEWGQRPGGDSSRPYDGDSACGDAQHREDDGAARGSGAAYDLSSFPEVLRGPDEDEGEAEESAADDGSGTAQGTPGTGTARRAYFEGDWVEEWLEAD
jgi:hypothetical protein